MKETELKMAPFLFFAYFLKKFTNEIDNDCH